MDKLNVTTNRIIMNTIKLGLQSKQLPIKYWEIMLPDALHSIRSLINTTTNETPHERLFNYQHKSTSGSSIPSCLSNPGKVLLKKFVQNSKYDQSVLQVDLIDANPQFAHIQYPDRRESTVSIKHLAPLTPRIQMDPEVSFLLNNPFTKTKETLTLLIHLVISSKNQNQVSNNRYVKSNLCDAQLVLRGHLKF